MFLFNKSKKNEVPAPAPVPSKPASSPIKQPVNADDFFKDMGRKPKPKKVDFNIESPEITGLREAPLPRPESTLSNLDTDAISTDGLRDKTLDVEEGLGNMMLKKLMRRWTRFFPTKPQIPFITYPLRYPMKSLFPPPTLLTPTAFSGTLTSAGIESPKPLSKLPK